MKSLLLSIKGIKPKDLFLIFAGSMLYVLSIKFFVTPNHLYNSGFMGVSQLLNDLIHHFGIMETINFAGYINFAMNLPLYFLAYKYISKKFLVGTILSVLIQTIGVSMVPDIPVSLLSNEIAALLVGAVVGGFGAGLVLQANCSAGGTDVLGVYTSLKWNISPGQLNIFFNALVYTICALVMSVETALLSILFIVIFSMAMDKVYLQNIEVSLMIFTDNKAVKQTILKDFHRGVTYWNGKGAYTEKDKEILMVVVSKYEVNSIRKKIKAMDPNSFIIINDSLEVQGGYEKRLVV